MGLLFLLGCTVALGCSGESEDDDRRTSCVRVCENTLDCSGGSYDCGESCRSLELSPCAAEAFRAFDCLEAVDVCDAPAGACAQEINAYDICLDAEGTGNCSPEDAPSSASCMTICDGVSADCFNTEADCLASCSSALARAETMGCASQFQSSLACLSTCDDICALADEDCEDAERVFDDCRTRYCEANPDLSPCP